MTARLIIGLVAGLVFCSCVSQASFAQEQGLAPVQLAAENDIRDAVRVQQIVDELTAKQAEVTCPADVLQMSTQVNYCVCLLEGTTATFHDLMTITKARHPEWQGRTLSYALGEENFTLNFVGYVGQDDACQSFNAQRASTTPSPTPEPAQ